jgi:hypothetical protein
MSRYLTLTNYDGSLGGLIADPAGPYDVASPGGLASMQHHWTHGLFGRPEQYSDAYFGTGDRYPAAEYGNLYVPNRHASIYELQYGPNSQATEYHTFSGEPYYWDKSQGMSVPSERASFFDGKKKSS